METAIVGFKDMRAAAEAAGQSASGELGVTVKHNTAKNGVEIYFQAKPGADVLARLKANGWRWAHRNHCWYQRFTSVAWSFAHEVAGLPLALSGATVEQARETVDRFDLEVEDRMAEACGL